MSKRDEAADEPSGSQQQPDPKEAPKRGPGRPRKLQQELIGESVPKRARGRPKGSKNKRPSNLQKKVLPSGEKRPRGRPRKWKSSHTPEPEQKECVSFLRNTPSILTKGISILHGIFQMALPQQEIHKKPAQVKEEEEEKED